MLNADKIFKHLVGITIFGVILFSTFLLENIEKFPSVGSKLPMRYVITTKRDLELYPVEFKDGRKEAVGILKSGETVDFEAWVCPYKKIKLSGGERYLILAEQDEIEIKLLKFYYF